MERQSIPLGLFPVTLMSFSGLSEVRGVGASAFCAVSFVLCSVFSPHHPSLRNVEESLHHVDATFFLGKVSFLVTGGKCPPRCLLLPTPHPGRAAAGPMDSLLRQPGC